MAVSASNISVAQNPNDLNGTIVTFTRSDSPTPVTIPVSIPWASNTTNQDIQIIKAAIQAYLAQVNGIAQVNAAAVGVVVT